MKIRSKLTLGNDQGDYGRLVSTNELGKLIFGNGKVREAALGKIDLELGNCIWEKDGWRQLKIRKRTVGK